MGWREYENECMSILFDRYAAHPEIGFVQHGGNRSDVSDIEVLVNGRSVFWVEAKQPGKAVLAVTTLDRRPDGTLAMSEATLDKLTLEVNANGNLVWVPGIEQLMPYIFDRTEEILAKEGRAYNIKEFEDDEEEADLELNIADMSYKLLLAQIVEQHYKSKQAAFLMTGTEPTPYLLDYAHMYDMYDMYLQIRAKGGGGDSLSPTAIGIIVSALDYAIGNGADIRYDLKTTPGRILISGSDRKAVLIQSFSDWPLNNLFVLEQPKTYARVKAVERLGTLSLRPQRNQLTIMFYGTLKQPIQQPSEDAWQLFDKALSHAGAQL